MTTHQLTTDQTTPPDDEPTDPRFTFGLIADVYDVLKQHGYVMPDEQPARNRAHTDTLCAMIQLVEAFEGRSRS